MTLSTASGDGIAIQDPDAGPLDPMWSVTLSVPAGTLALSGTAGLVGSGDGSGSLSYSGSLSALNAALEGLTFTASPGFEGDTTVSMSAQSAGTASVHGTVGIAIRPPPSGPFSVTNTDDAGPGSLRQAILDSNLAIGQTNAIDFAIPGTGVQIIEPASPLPAITQSVLIDGFSQPGYTAARR